ncbi:MAG: BTAD domain-containing putative transcriptional regulator [Dermatophilaceae bacterium]
MTAARLRHPSRVVLVAAAGYGKSSALEAERPSEGLLLRAAELLGRPVPSTPWLGIDDVEDLTSTQQRRLLEQLAAVPAHVPVAVASRTPIDASRLRGPLVHRDATHLALDGYGTAKVLAEEYGVVDPDAAATVQRLTDGWPALVHLAGDTLAYHPHVDLADALARPGCATAEWVESAVLGPLGEPSRTVLGLLADLGPATPGITALLDRHTGRHDLTAAVHQLRAVGLVRAHRRLGTVELLTPVPLVAEVLRRGDAHEEPDPVLLRAAAERFEADGLPFQAALVCARAADAAALAALLIRKGEQMLWQGYATGVVELFERLPGLAAHAAARRTLADAHRMAGDQAAALREFGPLLERTGGRGWDPGLASRVAMVHYARGESHQALTALDRADPSAIGTDQDSVDWLAGRVHVLVTRGQAQYARDLAGDTVCAAERNGDPRAVAAAHTAMARASVGSRKDAHHDLALRAAAQAGDVLIAVHALVNHSCRLLTAARYTEACAVSREAVRLAELGSPPGRYAVALHNLGQALMRVGDHAQASWQMQRAVAVFGRLGPGRSSMGMIGLAQTHHELGHAEAARTAYLEAVSLSSASGELQVLVRALAGLARLQARTHPEVAEERAAQAVRMATPGLLPFALVASGWVALARGDRDGATAWAQRAVASARDVQALDVLAEALELSAECVAVEHPGQARHALTEALGIWRDGGAAPAGDRAEVLLGRLADADGASRSRARDAARRLTRMGILQVHDRPVTDHCGTHRVAVNVLGGFTVSVNQRQVPLPAWRSRQARSLVKLLAARRGRPASRAYLCELLWPGDEPSKTGHRLSVLLATVRGVLDPDRIWPSDHHIGADLGGIWLDLRHVDLDADILLRDAELAAQLDDDTDGERVREILADIDRRYCGPAFEDDPYEDWADGFREQVRTGWLRSLRRLAALHSRARRHGDAQTLLVRLLAEDPYDALVHSLLVKNLLRAGRHGEARRAFARWQDAMAAIDAPAPDEAVLGGPVLTPR